MKKIIIKSIQRQTYEINHDFFNIEYPVFIDHLLILWHDEDSVVSNGTETIDDATTDDSTTDETLDFATLFYGAERVTIVGDFVEINTLDLPDHTSPFYPESDPLYAAYAGDNADLNTVITAGR